MKTLVTLILLIIFSACSITPEQKAKKAIKAKLELILNDAKSYEPVEFGRLEIARTELSGQLEYMQYLHDGLLWIKKTEKYKEMAETAITKPGILSLNKLANASLDSFKFYVKKQKDFEKTFKSDTIGWKMAHTFRSKNAMGGMVIDQYVFVLDKDLTTVTLLKKE